MSGPVRETIHKSKAVGSAPLVSLSICELFQHWLLLHTAVSQAKPPPTTFVIVTQAVGFQGAVFSWCNFILTFCLQEERSLGLGRLQGSWAGVGPALALVSLLWENTRQSALKKGGLVFLSPFEGTVHHGLVVKSALAMVAGVWGSWIHCQKVGGDRETERINVGARLASYFIIFIFIQSRCPVHGMVPHSRGALTFSAKPLQKHPHSPTSRGSFSRWF